MYIHVCVYDRKWTTKHQLGRSLNPNITLSVSILLAWELPMLTCKSPTTNTNNTTTPRLTVLWNPRHLASSIKQAVVLQAKFAKMSLWQSYRALAPRTRLFIGGGIMAYAAFGLLASDQAEQLLGWTATEEDRKRLKEEMPKVHVVDRPNK